MGEVDTAAKEISLLRSQRTLLHIWLKKLLQNKQRSFKRLRWMETYRTFRWFFYAPWLTTHWRLTTVWFRWTFCLRVVVCGIGNIWCISKYIVTLPTPIPLSRRLRLSCLFRIENWEFQFNTKHSRKDETLLIKNFKLQEESSENGRHRLGYWCCCSCRRRR